MRIRLKLFIAFITLSLSPNSYSFPELPFCPAGGPPGWLNHFNYKRDQNIWRRYSQLNPSAQNAGRYPGYYYAPAYPPAYRQYEYNMRPAPRVSRFQAN